jgi:excinuclease ABC subunit C
MLEALSELPDQPGVYLFRDRSGAVIYVGKAKSIRRRVASHFSARGRGGAAHAEMLAQVQSVECVVVGDEAEALLSEEAFIKRHRPRFNVRLRDDKSYPYIAISLDEQFPRVYFTREQHLPGRLYFGPYTNAKRVRATLDVLQRAFYVRSCTGPDPGRRSGSPCLDYYIKRCQAPCVGHVSEADYRRNIEAAAELLAGRYHKLEREIEARMAQAAAERQFEQAALERNRLRAIRSLLSERTRALPSDLTLDAVAVACEGADCNAQVLQVRDGRLTDRLSFYLHNAAERPAREVLEQFLLQYYSASGRAIPPLVLVESNPADHEALALALSRRRGARVRLQRPQRTEKRELLVLAQRNARLALGQERLRSEHRRQERAEALSGLADALALPAPPVRIECFDVSNLGGTHTVASMVVFEGGQAKRGDYRRFKIRTIAAGDDYAAIAEVTERRHRAYLRQRELSLYDPEYDASFAATPDLIVIDGGSGQLASALASLEAWRAEGVRVVALAKRLEEIYTEGARAPLRLDRHSHSLRLLQRIRDEAHRFAITHHRGRRARAAHRSLLDDLPGIGPARKRALLTRFGSPQGVLAASAEELHAVPGIPAKVAGELYLHLHRAG